MTIEGKTVELKSEYVDDIIFGGCPSRSFLFAKFMVQW